MNYKSNKMDTFEKNKSIIIKTLLGVAPDLTAIIMYGSYGRDEGGWFQDNSGKWCPYNDYDLCIISELKIKDRYLSEAKKNIADAIGIKWVDLCQFSQNELKIMPISILNYDFKNGSSVIYGSDEIISLIPNFISSNILLKEAEVLFFTRIYTFLGSIDVSLLGVELDGEAVRFFRNQMAKAILAVVDALLIAKKSYNSSYHKRVELLEELYPDNSELINLSRWALLEKLNPKSPKMSQEDMVNLYKAVHKIYFHEMYKVLSFHFKRKIDSPENIEFSLKWNLRSILFRAFWIIRFRNFDYESEIKIKSAMLYIAVAWNGSCVSDQWLSRGIKLLTGFDRTLTQMMTWNQARFEALRISSIRNAAKD